MPKEIKKKTDSNVQTSKLISDHQLARSDTIAVRKLVRERIVTTITRIHFWTRILLHVLFVPLRSMSTIKLLVLVMIDVGKGPINMVFFKLAWKAKRLELFIDYFLRNILRSE